MVSSFAGEPFFCCQVVVSFAVHIQPHTADMYLSTHRFLKLSTVKRLNVLLREVKA